MLGLACDCDELINILAATPHLQKTGVSLGTKFQDHDIENFLAFEQLSCVQQPFRGADVHEDENAEMRE